MAMSGRLGMRSAVGPWFRPVPGTAPRMPTEGFWLLRPSTPARRIALLGPSPTIGTCTKGSWRTGACSPSQHTSGAT
eukprot:9006536-Pyramimonas_sp.AAC.1